MQNELTGDAVIDQIKEITLFSLFNDFEIMHVNSNIIFITLAFFRNFHNFFKALAGIEAKERTCGNPCSLTLNYQTLKSFGSILNG